MVEGGRLIAALAAVCAGAWAFAQQTPTPQPQPQPQPELATIRGSVMKLEGSHLLVGLQDGGIVSFDPITTKPRFSFPGDGSGAVVDVALFGNRAFWALDGTQVVRTCLLGNTIPLEVDLRGTGFVGPVRRLTVWQEMIVAHGDVGLRFIEPQSLQVRYPEEVLPSEVASAANAGMATSTWKEGKGLFVVVRMFGEKKNPKEGEVNDLGLVTAWSAAWRSPYKLLGSYTCDITEFQDPPGLTLASQIPSGSKSAPGSGPIGNLKVGPEGIIALDYDEALTMPLYKDNWVPARVKTAVPPKYAQIAAYFNSEIWWADGRRLLHASLEDGATDVYLPRVHGEVKSIVADEEGAWVMLEEGVRRVSTMEEEPGTSFVRYEVSPEAAQPGWGGRSRLAWVLKRFNTPGAVKPAVKSSVEFVKAALKTAGVTEKKIATLHGPTDTPQELEYGDVLVHAGQAVIYVGNGRVASWKNGLVAYGALDLSPDARIHRFFSSGGSVPRGAHALPIAEIGPVFPIGVGKPNPRLGHDLFVRVNPDSPYDGPHLPVHYQLLSIIEDWQGTPYRWGGQTMDGTDCSGFVMSVFRELGVSLPRHSQTMGRAPFGEVVFDELRFGDVLVYPHPKHVAIYIGKGRTAETVRGGVGYSTVWRRNRAVVRRFLVDAD